MFRAVASDSEGALADFHRKRSTGPMRRPGNWNLSPEERLRLHQAESGPVMEDLHARLQRQLDGRFVGPNSGLGEAITYMLKHGEPLALFLRQAGATLDKNICEGALEKAILQRKNALFCKSENGVLSLCRIVLREKKAQNPAPRSVFGQPDHSANRHSRFQLP